VPVERLVFKEVPVYVDKIVDRIVYVEVFVDKVCNMLTAPLSLLSYMYLLCGCRYMPVCSSWIASSTLDFSLRFVTC